MTVTAAVSPEEGTGCSREEDRANSGGNAAQSGGEAGGDGV